MLPDIDGIEVCKRIRQDSDVPILMLTARDEDVDKIIGLEVGADDYLTKPFNPRELVARIRSILRRAAPERRERESETIQHGDLHVDAGRREVHVGDEEIQLAPKEFDLLWELLDHRGLVLTRDQLLERVWGYTFAGDTRTVDVHVRQLRRKLGDASPIVTVWGVGYKVSPAREPQKDARPRSDRRLSVFSSLRVRLPLLFLAGIVLAGLVDDADRGPALPRLRARPDARASCGARRTASRSSTRTRSTPTSARRRSDSRRAPTFARANLEKATGDRIYFDGPVNPFPGEKSGLRPLDLKTIDWTSGEDADVRVHAARAEAHLPRGRAARCSSAQAADRRDRRREAEDDVNQRVLSLVERLAIAGALGLLVAGAARAGTSRGGSSGRCSRSRAPPTRSRAGNYDVEVPRARGGRDRPSGRALRRDGRRGWPRPRRASGTS